MVLGGILAGCVVRNDTSEPDASALADTAVAAAEEGGESLGSPSTADTGTAPTGDVVTGSAGPPPTCTYTGNRNGFIKLDLVFTNPFGEVSGVELSYALFDAGVRFIDGDETFVLPKANEQFRDSLETIDKLPADIDEATISCEVLAVDSFPFPFDRGPEAGTCTIQPDDTGGSGLQAELLVTNPFAQTRDVAFFYALRAQGSVRFGFGQPLAELLRGAEQMSFTEKVGELPAWVDPAAVTCDVLGFYGR